MLHPLMILAKLNSFFRSFLQSTSQNNMEENLRRHAPGEDRVLDLRINFNTAHKYDALTDWATGGKRNSNAWSLSITVHSPGQKEEKLLI